MNHFVRSIFQHGATSGMMLAQVIPLASAAPLVAAGGTLSMNARDGGFLWGSGHAGIGQIYYGSASALMAGRSWMVLRSTLGIDTDGALWAWGRDLGVTSPGISFYPIQVGTDKDWRSISPQTGYSFAVKTDGTLWGWGNFNVSNVPVFFSQTPVRFGSSSDWHFVTGSGYNLAIKTNGTMWAWGHNGHGNLGDGTVIPRTEPVQVGGDNQWATAACVGWTSFGIKTDGSLWVWGSNGGAYGNGNSSVTSPVPVRVGTDNNWLKVTGTGSAVIAIRSDGSLWSWGQNPIGMLGLGNVTSQLVPARIGEESTWADVAAGDSHVIAARNDGSVWAWGNNGARQFGLAEVSSSNVPLEVTAGFVAKPRFAVYRDSEPLLDNSAFLTAKTAILQEPTVIDIKVRNNGFAPLSLSAGELQGFTVVSPGEVAGLSDSTLQVRLNADVAGQFSGQVAVNSNDPGRPQFKLHLNGTVVSPANDTDGDGMNDAAEVALEALGFRWNSNQAALVTTFYGNVGLAGLHQEREIMDVHWKSGSPLIDASGGTIRIPLELDSAPGSSSPLLEPGNVRQTSGHSLEVSVPLPAGKRFLRLKQR